MKPSISKQIENLVMMDKMLKRGQFKNGAIAIVVVLLALGFYTRLPPYFMIAAFIGLVIFAAFRSSPHLDNAVRAITEGQKKSGFVKVEEIYDSNAFTAIVENSTHGTWQFSFNPTGWKPTKGEFPATIYHLVSVDWPVLIEVEQGIMVPRETPESVK